jgi:hypothetical protein
MADKDMVNKARGVAREITELDPMSLMERPEWGTIKFQDVEAELKLVEDLAGHITSLPIELMPQGALEAVHSHLVGARDTLRRIDRFDISALDNPKGERENIAERLRGTTNNLLTSVQGWIGFLAYQSGDVQRNIRELNDAVGKAKMIVGGAETYAGAKAKEVDGIVSAAREASASVGVGHFTSDFAGEVTRMRGEAKTWLVATAIFGAVTLATAVAFLFIRLQPDATSAQVVHFITSKLITLAVLLTATVWCGRLFKAAKHQAAMNHHRANALKSFQAFVNATDDPVTRDAVLLETTRSIFAIAPSGYLEATETSPESGAKMLEVVRAAKS